MQIIRSAGTRLLALGVLSWTAAVPAHAHFLWASIVPGSKPTLQIRFTESPQEKTLPALLPRLRPSRTWSAEKFSTKSQTETVTASTRHLSLLTGDGLREAALNAETRLAAAEQIWGVMDKAAEGRGVFLLKYYAKAASETDAAEGLAGLPVEITVTHKDGKYTATVLRDGKPVPGAELIVVRPGNQNALARKTDSKGTARFENDAAGMIGIRAMVAEDTKGEYEGKAYAQVKHYSTLTFPTPTQTRLASAGTETATPTNPKADPQAFALLKSAHDRRYVMPATTGDVSGKVSLNDNGKMVTGEFAYSPKEGVTLKAEGASDQATEWLRGQLSNIFAHRRGGDFAKSYDGQQALTFSNVENDSPLGRQIAMNDVMQSFYRVKDRTVMEVTRTSGDTRFTVTVLDVDTVDGGRYLPRHFVVTYFDAKTGQLRRTESFSDTYAQSGSLWIPASRRVVMAENGVNVVRILELSGVTTTAVNTASR